jgi:membrane protein implicated in regulation of membrane protease activity
MAWWTWFVVGTLLLGIELFAVDAQFFLIFLGASAIIVGVVGMLGIDLPNWLQWVLFSGLAVATIVGFRGRVYAMLRQRPLAKVDTDVHQRVRIPEELPPGKTTRVEYRGSGWTAKNVGHRMIAAGEEARIESVEGLTLHVRLN